MCAGSLVSRTGLSQEPAMNGASGFLEVRSSTFRSSYRFLHEQRYQFSAGAWHLHCTHDLISPCTGTSTKGEPVPETFPRSPVALQRKTWKRNRPSEQGRQSWEAGELFQYSGHPGRKMSWIHSDLIRMKFNSTLGRWPRDCERHTPR